ncbi:MAG: hypothetical protein IT215_02045, partial [Chitinophagaceae bacterium]|nr:hypothetical protein [Chitinophagaceae bacterium]
GKQVAHFHFLNRPAGVYHETLPTSQLPQGTYFVKCIVGDKISFTSFQKM